VKTLEEKEIPFPDNVIYCYTDKQALEDGTLVDVRGIAPFPINRATRAVWDEFTRPIGKLPRSLGASPVTDTTRFSRLAKIVGRKISSGDLVEGWVIIEDYEGKKVWAMPNETLYRPVPPYAKPGWTIMFPEDY